MADYPYGEFSIISATNPDNLAGQNDYVLIHAPGDASRTPIEIRDLGTGQITGNPIASNRLARCAGFIATIPEAVAYAAGPGIEVLLESTAGMRNATVEAAANAASAENAATNAAATAAAAAQADLEARIAAGQFEGPQGKSAYQLAVEAGFVGTEAEWRASLKGLPGTNAVPADEAVGTYATTPGTATHTALTATTAGVVDGKVGAPTIKLVVWAGQSNSLSSAPVPSGFNTADDRLLFMDAAGAVVPLPVGQASPATQYAREQVRREPVNVKILIVHTGVGGTGFSTTSLASPPAGYGYKAGGTWDRTLTTDPLNNYTRMLTRIQTAYDYVTAQTGKTAEILHFGWSQGEDDVWRLDKATYAAKLDDLIAQLRVAFPAFVQAPVIVTSMQPEWVESVDASYVDDVAAALLEAPRRSSRVAFVQRPRGYGSWGDPIHASAQGQTVIAPAIASAMTVARANLNGVGPLPPRNLAYTRNGDTVTVTWDAPLSRALSYKLEYSSDSGAIWTVAPLASPNQTSATFTLAAASPLSLRATTTNTEGTSVPTTIGNVSAAPAYPADMTYVWQASSISALDGETVARWDSGTSGVYFTNATTTAQPKLRVASGEKMVRFDGVDDYYDISGLASANVKTLSMLVRVNNAPGSQAGIMQLGGGLVQRDSLNRVSGSFLGSASPVVGADPTGVFRVITVVNDGTTRSITADAIGTANITGTGTITDLKPGRANASLFGDIDVVEVRAWSRALTATEIGEVYTVTKSAHPGILA